ncbi:MAG: hypothetical protein NTY74_13860 [Ignavibacteriae bacterium]|nr:hypothetical protein [Ignavibacteriota bacterium]
MRKTCFLVICLVLFFSGCENKENKISEANKKELQSKILNESHGAIELVDFKITSSLGSGNDALFEGVIEFKDDVYKEFYSNLLDDSYKNPFINFAVSKKAPINEKFLRTFNNLYKKNERVKIRGKFINATIETEGDIKYK